VKLNPFRRTPSNKWVLEAFDIIGEWGPVEGSFVKGTLNRHGRLLHHFDNSGVPYESMMKLLQEMVDISGFEQGDYRRRPLRIINRDGDIMPFEVLGIHRSPSTMKAEEDIQAGSAMTAMQAPSGTAAALANAWPNPVPIKSPYPHSLTPALEPGKPGKPLAHFEELTRIYDRLRQIEEEERR
jgi:hypothetical protein